MDRPQRNKLDKSVRTFLGRQLRLYYGIIERDLPPRFAEMLRELDTDQSPKLVPLNAARKQESRVGLP